MKDRDSALDKRNCIAYVCNEPSSNAAPRRYGCPGNIIELRLQTKILSRLSTYKIFRFFTLPIDRHERRRNRHPPQQALRAHRQSTGRPRNSQKNCSSMSECVGCSRVPFGYGPSYLLLCKTILEKLLRSYRLTETILAAAASCCQNRRRYKYISSSLSSRRSIRDLLE